MFQPQSTFIYHGFKNKATQSCDIGCFKLLDPCLMIHFNGFASIFLKKIQEIQKNCIFPGLFQDFPGDTKKSRRFQIFQEVWEPWVSCFQKFPLYAYWDFINCTRIHPVLANISTFCISDLGLYWISKKKWNDSMGFDKFVS